MTKLAATRGQRVTRLSAAVVLVGAILAGGASPAAAAGPNIVSQWDKIAEDTVVGSGAQQIESLIYLSYTQAAVYDAVVAIEGGYEPYGPPLTGPAGASTEAAVVEAAYTTLSTYFPASAAALLTARNLSLSAIADGTAKTDGLAVGYLAARNIVTLREGDGRLTPIAATSPFPTKTAAPGVWRLTPPAYAAPQVPWAGSVKPFVLKRPDQFRPAAPPSLTSWTWVTDFKEIKKMGGETSAARTAEQTAVARFYTANVPRQWNRLVRDIAEAKSLSVLQTARLAAMINMVGADAGIGVMNAKYHYLFWRPVTAIDPGSVKPTGDGFGPIPGFTDGNPRTVEQPGWRSLITTPNHPEYPAAHGTITAAISEVLTTFLGTSWIDVDVHGFDTAGLPGNLDAVRHFDKAGEMRREIVNARLWGGVHYRHSTEVGVALGRNIAKYDLRHAFEAVE